jgi:hypothetical protein
MYSKKTSVKRWVNADILIAYCGSPTKARNCSFAKLRDDLLVPKARKYRCCIRIESADENGQDKLILFIKGREVEAPSEKHIALLDYLHKNRGHLVTYQQLGLILGHKSFRKPQLHVLRQYVSWIGKTLASHKALCIVAVAPDVGYVLCAHE